MLFDSSKNVYHLTMQEFSKAGGVQALFNLFHWVLEEYLQNVSEITVKKTVGTIEFLEGWLDLVNTTVNTKKLMESTHSLPSNTTDPLHEPFKQCDFLLHAHKVRRSTFLVDLNELI